MVIFRPLSRFCAAKAIDACKPRKVCYNSRISFSSLLLFRGVWATRPPEAFLHDTNGTIYSHRRIGDRRIVGGDYAHYYAWIFPSSIDTPITIAPGPRLARHSPGRSGRAGGAGR